MASQPFLTLGLRPYDRWWLRAACGPRDADLFFPEPGSLSRKEWRRREQAAKQVCAVCPVRPSCLEEALLKPEEYGVWGGMTADERARALHETATVQAAPVTLHPTTALAALAALADQLS
jgi:WhiB family redox-sensing transcriptional regulator